MLFVCNGYAGTLELCCFTLLLYISLFLLYIPPLYIYIYITLLKFLSSQVFQRSKDNVAIEESKFSIPVKSKEKDNVEGDKNKINSEMINEDDSNLMVKVSNFIEHSRDKDDKILYELMSLNMGIYKTGDYPSTARRQKNSLHCNELCPCPVDECNFGGFTKWLGNDKRKLVLERLLNSYRK